MIKNNKGFLLAEAVIVSAVVVTTLVALYASINKLYIQYTNRSRYYGLDGIYAIKTLTNDLIDTNKINQVLNNVESNNFTYLIDNYNCVSQLADDTLCSSMVDFYNVKSMVITKKDKTYFPEVEEEGIVKKETFFGKTVSELGEKGINLNQTFKDYLQYLYKYYSGDSDTYSYLIILEYGEDDNKLYYSNLRLS